ncbi:hypothetical protein Hanom_Chr10g00966111 [Helianthus anomalus]
MSSSFICFAKNGKVEKGEGVWEKRKGKKVCSCGVKRLESNTLFITPRRHLVHLFSCRRLQMWSADCRPFTSEKTNTT